MSARPRGGSCGVVAGRAARWLLAAAVLTLTPWPAIAWAAFAGSVAADGASLATYTVPVPGGIACRGLSSLLSSRLVWDAVTPPPGNSVIYEVTAPGGRVTTTAATSFQLPTVTLPGQYQVRAQISSGWRSQPATITVSLTAFGLLYLCSVP